MAFKVKVVTDVCPRRLSMLVSGRRKGKQAAGKSFGWLVSLFSELLVVYMYMLAGASSPPQLVKISSL